MPAGSDKALRRLVSELAGTTPEDMAAVLALLEPRAAAQLRALLAAYAGVDDVFDLSPAPALAALDVSGFSDGLAARVTGRTGEGAAAYTITPHVQAALHDIATSMPPQIETREEPLPAPRQRTGTASQRFHSLFGAKANA